MHVTMMSFNCTHKEDKKFYLLKGITIFECSVLNRLIVFPVYLISPSFPALKLRK